MLKFRYRMEPRKLAIYPAAGPAGRILRLRQIVSGLIRYERVEPEWQQADEARQYAERLIYLAIKNGDKHRETMELADYWLMEKDLIHKLFKVLVPRYRGSTTCYTDLHKLPVTYPGDGRFNGLLELRGNPWPPAVPRQRNTSNILTNVLLSAARHDFHKQKHQGSVSEVSSSASSSPPLSFPAEADTSSSVDPPSSESLDPPSSESSDPDTSSSNR